MPAPVPLDNLIDFVRSRHPGGDAVVQLGDAVTVADELQEQADALIGYFVDQARGAGATWSQIGGAMGVSRQAAQKRFMTRDELVPPGGEAFSRFTPRARAAVASAAAMARAEGVEVGPLHVLAAAVADRRGVAALAIERLGVDEAAWRAGLGVPATATAKAEDEAAPSSLGEIEWGPEARAVLKASLKAALRLGHNYIGTEHLLLGAAGSSEPVRGRLADMGLTPELVEQAVSVEIAALRLELERKG